MNEITLKDGRIVTLDWKPEYRPENLNFVSSADNRPIKESYWDAKCLDQGQEGACAAFGSGGALSHFFPEADQITNKFCFDNYEEAKKIDPFPGENYSGTTINAALKVLKNLGWIESYYWHMRFHDMVVDLSYRPVVLGLPWFEGMYQPDSNGHIHMTGRKTGGHCLMGGGNDKPVNERSRLHNSWGDDWGPMGSDCWIDWETLEKLYNMGGQSAVITPAKNVPTQEVQKRLNFLQRILQRLWG